MRLHLSILAVSLLVLTNRSIQQTEEIADTTHSVDDGQRAEVAATADLRGDIERKIEEMGKIAQEAAQEATVVADAIGTGMEEANVAALQSVNELRREVEESAKMVAAEVEANVHSASQKISDGAAIVIEEGEHMVKKVEEAVAGTGDSILHASESLKSAASDAFEATKEFIADVESKAEETAKSAMASAEKAVKSVKHIIEDDAKFAQESASTEVGKQKGFFKQVKNSLGRLQFWKKKNESSSEL